jgi:hypothetical protein
MFKAKELEVLADLLGNHVIPELLTRVEYGGSLNWDMHSVTGFYRVEQFLIKEFNKNPNFKLDLFNKRMLGYAEEQFKARNLHHMIIDVPGLRLLEEQEPPNHTFHLSHQSRILGLRG